MAKPTNAQLTARISQLEAERIELRKKIEELEASLEKGLIEASNSDAYYDNYIGILENIKVLAYNDDHGYCVVKIKEAMNNPLISIVENVNGLNISCKPITQPQGRVPVENSKIKATMEWLCAYVGYGEMPEEALVGTFEAYTNAERSWLAVYPKEALPVTERFVQDLNHERWKKGIRGDYYRNRGLWVEVKR